MIKLARSIIRLLFWLILLFCIIKGSTGCSEKDKSVPQVKPCETFQAATDSLKAKVADLQDSCTKLNARLDNCADDYLIKSWDSVSVATLQAALMSKYKDQAKHVKLPKIKVK